MSFSGHRESKHYFYLLPLIFRFQMQKRTMRDEKILIISSTFRLSIKQRLISNPLDSDFFRLPKNVVPVGSG